MTRKLTTRTSTAGSPSPNFKHQGNLVDRIIEVDGKKFRVETLGGKEFKLPIYSGNSVNWKAMSPDERVAYTVAYCLENKCGIAKLPGNLYSIINSSEEERRRILEGIGRKFSKTEILCGIIFCLPLDFQERISWSSMSPDERVEYAIAYCKEKKCGIGGLPCRLYSTITSSEEEKRRVLEGLGMPTEKVEILCGEEFKLPLDNHGRVSWLSMSPDQRIAYAAAFCKHHSCRIGELPSGLYLTLNSSEEIRRVLEELGIHSEKVETLCGKEFKLPLNAGGTVSWKQMTSDERVAYAIAYCIYNNCGISELPSHLRKLLRSNQEELRQVLEGLGRKSERTETLAGQTFTLPLNKEGTISWISMTPEQRISYAIAYCKEKKCKLGKLPHGLRLVINANQETETVLEGLGVRTKEIQTVHGEIFVLPVNRQGNIAWKRMTPKERISYVIAYCLEHKCSISVLPNGIYFILTPEQKSYITQELSKSTESDQLADLANAMEGF